MPIENHGPIVRLRHLLHATHLPRRKYLRSKWTEMHRNGAAGCWTGTKFHISVSMFARLFWNWICWFIGCVTHRLRRFSFAWFAFAECDAGTNTVCPPPPPPNLRFKSIYLIRWSFINSFSAIILQLQIFSIPKVVFVAYEKTNWSDSPSFCVSIRVAFGVAALSGSRSPSITSFLLDLIFKPIPAVFWDFSWASVWSRWLKSYILLRAARTAITSVNSRNQHQNWRAKRRKSEAMTQRIIAFGICGQISYQPPHFEKINRELFSVVIIEAS